LENLKNIQEMIRFADQKAGAVLVVYGFLITVYSETGKGLIFSFKSATPMGISTFIVGAVSGGYILGEVIRILLNIVRPRLATGYNSNERCLYYFDHIVRCTRQELVDSILNINEATMIADIATQIHENSKVLNAKLEAVKASIDRLIISGLGVVVYAITAKFLEGK
jgi:hypothetical protein